VIARTCSDCPSLITRQSKTGRCRPCSAKRLTSDPELAARRLEGVRQWYDERGGREMAGLRLAELNRNPTPALEAARKRQGQKQIAYLLDPDIRARSASPQSRAKAEAKKEETLLGWCPPERRDEYRQMLYSSRLHAAEARRIIEADIPGTAAHAERVVAQNLLNARLKHEREQAQAY